MFARVIPVDVYFIFSVPLLAFVQREIVVKKNSSCFSSKLTRIESRINQAHINGNTPVASRCVTFSSQGNQSFVQLLCFSSSSHTKELLIIRQTIGISTLRYHSCLKIFWQFSTQVIWPHQKKKVPYKLQINTMHSLVPSSRSPQKKT